MSMPLHPLSLRPAPAPDPSAKSRALGSCSSRCRFSTAVAFAGTIALGVGLAGTAAATGHLADATPASMAPLPPPPQQLLMPASGDQHVAPNTRTTAESSRLAALRALLDPVQCGSARGGHDNLCTSADWTQSIDLTTRG